MKGVYFPPGDTRFDSDTRNLCLWRELTFALFLIRLAANPRLNMAECLAKWNCIAAELAEGPRKRGLQAESLYNFEGLLG